MRSDRTTTVKEPLLRPSEVAAALAVSRDTVYALVERGELAAVRVGGQFRFRRADVEALMAGGDATT
jgi:excisionase family DNA binding protein